MSNQATTNEQWGLLIVPDWNNGDAEWFQCKQIPSLIYPHDLEQAIQIHNTYSTSIEQAFQFYLWTQSSESNNAVLKISV